MKNQILVCGLLFSLACSKKESTTKPVYKDITETVFASGRLEPEGKYNLTAQTEGYITALYFKENDLVTAGQLLCEVENKQSIYNENAAENLLRISRINVGKEAPLLRQTQANLELAQEKWQQEQRQFARYEKLWASKSISKLELENARLALENAKTNLKSLEESLKLQKQQAEQQLINQEAQQKVNKVFAGNNQIRALVAGKVFQKTKEQGDFVRKGDVLAVIGKPEKMYARLNIDESNIAKVRLGQSVQIQLNSLKDSIFTGEVFDVLPAFEESSQSFIVKVKFLQKPAWMLSGTQLQANLIVGSKKRAFVIPRALLDYGNKVFLKGKEDPVVVKTGFKSSEWVEILSGLNANDELVEIRK